MNFQKCVSAWVRMAFGNEIAMNQQERNFRFLEETLELVQSTGMTEKNVLKIVSYVYNRPVGNPAQEIGGVLVTLAALCQTNGFDMEDCGEAELIRAISKTSEIQAKQQLKTESGVTAY